MRQRPATLLLYTAIAISLSFTAVAQPTPTSLSLVGTTTCSQATLVTVNLSAPAPAAGLVIQLASSLPNIVPVPSSITAIAGAASAGFSVTCVPSPQALAVTLTATAGGVSRTAILNVLAPVLNSISLKPETGSTNLLGAVRLVGPAPAGGVIVTLSNSHPSLVTVPSSVTVPAGTEGTNFTVTDVDPVGQPTTFTVTGTGLGTTKSTTFTLQPPGPSSVTFSTGTSFTSSRSVIGGRAQTAKVTLSGIAGGGGVTVQLASSATAAASVPPSVTVSAGQTEASFQITTVPVAQTASVAITGTVGNVSKSGSLTVQAPALDIFTSTPTTLIGGQSAQGRVFITGDAPSGGLSVSLSSSNTARAQVPSSVTIPAGGKDATFQIASFPLENPVGVTVSASAGGVSRAVSLSVVPEGPSSLTLNPAQTFGGSNSTGQVNAIASDDSFVVQLTSSDPTLATVPTSVSFGPGETAKSFTITTTPVIERKFVTISAKTMSRGTTVFSVTGTTDSSFSVTRTATLTVKPPEPTQVTLTPARTPGFSNVTGTVTLNRAAPAGLVIQVTSSNETVAGASGFTATTGALTHSFIVNARDVQATGTATITVTIGGVKRSAFLTVDPR